MCNLSDVVNSIPFSGPIFFGIITYGILEWVLHAIVAGKVKIDKITPNKTIKLLFSWKIIFPILSIGYAFADYYKGEESGEKRKSFIEMCNCYNFFLA